MDVKNKVHFDTKRFIISSWLIALERSKVFSLSLAVSSILSFIDLNRQHDGNGAVVAHNDILLLFAAAQTIKYRLCRAGNIC